MRDGRSIDARGFDEGRFLNRNIWDRRYPVVDEERGIVLSIVRFGLKAGAQSQSAATSNDRLVAEFFAVKRGYIQEIQAVLFNLPDAKPTGWPADTGPGRRFRQIALGLEAQRFSRWPSTRAGKNNTAFKNANTRVERDAEQRGTAARSARRAATTAAPAARAASTGRAAATSP